MIPNLDEICTCCGGYEKQPILQLFNDGCFRIVDGKDAKGDFCIKDFAFPVDGYTCLGLNLELDGGEITIFNNNLELFSPNVELLESGKSYARGVLIRIYYPTNDSNGEEIEFADKSVRVYIENAESLVGTDYPMYDLFAMFTNAKSNKLKDLINKIKIINPNELYGVRVTALVLFGNAE